MNPKDIGYKIEAGPNVSGDPDNAANVADAPSQSVSLLTRAKITTGLLLTALTPVPPETPEGYLKPGEAPGALEMDEATGVVRATGQLYGAYGQPVEPPMGVRSAGETRS